MIVTLGYPRYSRAGRRRARALRGLGMDVLPVSLLMPFSSWLTGSSSPAPASSPAPDCPWWLWLEGNYLACTQQPDLMAAEQAQIQSVADNAAKYYGADSYTAQVAQQAANQQIAGTASDVAAVTTDVMNSQVDQSPITWLGNYALNPGASDSSGQTSVPTWLWWVLGGTVVLFAVSYAVR